MKHILLALFLITSTAHGALTKVPAAMATAGVVYIPNTTTPIIRRTGIVTCATSSSIVSFGLGSQAWMTSMTNISSGSCTVTMPSTSFPSGSFACQISARGGASAASNVWKIRDISGTQFEVSCYNANAACTNPSDPVHISCDGI